MKRLHFSRVTSLVLIAAMNAFTAGPLAAQKKNQPAPETPKLSESIDVRVIGVDVVVTDKKGNSVTGLTKDDFQIFENGTEKPISNFYEIEGKTAAQAVVVPTPGAPAVAPPKEEINEQLRRRIILYIDNLSLAPFNRNRVFKQMKDFVKDVMRPGDEAMVATYNRSLKVRAPFTRDPIQIQQTLDAIAGESALGTANRSEFKDVTSRINDAQSYEEATATARAYAGSVEHDLRQSVESISGLMTTLAGVEGKKILVLTTEGFQIQPGREAFTLIDEVAREKNWQSSSMLEAMGFNANTLIESIARNANANGITIYPIHAGGLAAGNEGMTADNQQATSYNVTSAAVSNTTESLQLMAEMTGGVATARTNNFAGAFKNIVRDLDSYYSLGYRAGTERVDRQRELEVRVKNRNLRVRNRQTFVEKSTFQEMSDRVIANLLYKTKANDLGIRVKVDSPVPANDLFRVPVEVHIPIDSLTLLQQGEAYMGGFSLYVVVGNKDGDMSDVSRKSHQITIPVTDFAKAKGKYYTYTLDLMCERGLNKISVGVVDDVSNTSGFDKQQVIAQDR
ncbi:MAG TPA: VWA domain-containing protein [Thermoanaerobaculia bacterium]|nr:VWA domain-containing protein [Thermoanaerobaculia bacterium]